MEFNPVVTYEATPPQILNLSKELTPFQRPIKQNRARTDHTYIQTDGESPEDRKKRFARERQRRRRAKLNTEQLAELREYDRHRHVVREINETAGEKQVRRHRMREAVKRFRANETVPKKLMRQIKDAEWHAKYRTKNKEYELEFEDNKMVLGCAISTCSNIGRENNITYFKFPTDRFLRIMWTDRSYRADNFNPNMSCICSAHFNKEDFESTPPGCRLRLKRGAIPSEELINKSKHLVGMKLPGIKIIDWIKIDESIVKARQRELLMSEMVDKPSLICIKGHKIVTHFDEDDVVEDVAEPVFINECGESIEMETNQKLE